MKWNEYTNTMDVWNKKPFTPEEKILDVSEMHITEVTFITTGIDGIPRRKTTKDIIKVYP